MRAAAQLQHISSSYLGFSTFEKHGTALTSQGLAGRESLNNGILGTTFCAVPMDTSRHEWWKHTILKWLSGQQISMGKVVRAWEEHIMDAPW